MRADNDSLLDRVEKPFVEPRQAYLESGGAAAPRGANRARYSQRHAEVLSVYFQTHPSGLFTVNGAIAWNSTTSGWGDSLLTAGTLRAKGSWTMPCSGAAVFNASGTHTVEFNGTAAQTINSGCAHNFTAQTAEHFQNITVSNSAAAVSFPGTYFAVGTVTVNAGATLAGGGTLHIRPGNLAVSGTYSITNTTIKGTGGSTPLPAVAFNSLVLDSVHNHTVPASGFSVTNALTLSDFATLDIGANSATAGSFNNNSGARVRMIHPSGVFTINGAAAWNSTTSTWGDSLLTAGTMHVKGNWTIACSGNHAYNAAGTHTVNFSGTVAQTVASGCVTGFGTTQEHFRNVTLSNTAAATTFNGTYFASGTVTVNAGATLAGGGTLNLRPGNLANSGTYSITNTTIKGTGGSTPLAAITFPSLVLDSAHTHVVPASGFAVTNNLTLSNGAVIDAGSGTATVGTMNLNTSSRFRQVLGTSVFTVNGNLVFNASGVAYEDTSVTAGKLRVGGTFSTTCATNVFNATGSHEVEFFGAGPLSLSNCATTGLTPDKFHLQHVTANLSSGTLSLPAFDILGKLRVSSGAVSASNPTVWDSVVVAGGTLGGSAVTFRKSGQVIPANTLTTVTLKVPGKIEGGISSGAITVDSGQLNVTGNATVAGLTTSSTGKLDMLANHTLTVNGSVSFQGGSTAGLLKAGRLELTGHFNQGTNSLAFAADSVHATAFIGTAQQNITFSNPGETLSRFGILESRNVSTAGVVLFTNAAATNNLVVPGGLTDSVRLKNSGSPVLTVGGVDVSNTGSTRAYFNNVGLVIKNIGLKTITQFDGASFKNFSTAATQLSFQWSIGGTFTFNGTKFYDTPPATGFYVAMNSPATLNLSGTTPTLAANGGRTSVIGGGTLNWTP
ncbi:MAG: hypothetical protein FJ202_01225 [Gemmatimonadetes bacterium]|nr:hypothetical protein [Gemmatimonadota bacterium]